MQYFYGRSSDFNWNKKHSKKIHQIASTKQRYYLPKVHFDQKRLICSYGNTVQYWNLLESQTSDFKQLSPPTKIYSPHFGEITDFQLLADSWILSGSSTDYCAKIWKLTNGVIARTFSGHRNEVRCVHSNSTVVCTGSFDRTVKLWNKWGKLDKDSATCLRTVDLHDRVWTLKSSETRVYVGSSGTSSQDECPFHVLDIETGALKSLEGHRGPVYDIDCAGDRFPIVTGSFDGCSKLWDLRLKEPCVMKMEDNNDYPIYCVKFDGNWKLVTGTAYHSTIRVWDIRSGKHLQSIFVDPSRHSQGVVYSLDFDDTAIFAALSNGVHQLDFV